ncbi:polar amino acid transport system permease protein [Halolactibacillus halophilus]|uniref:Ectoine/hydroxyectoine ABC transporter permease subunit EhuD n=1 Tax=Halolactibacillus halophilus TaxID=306540 RepID=A0A1I5T191_9BACI|nr:ectoine/hydroxyectoine ABC transporter permease subunit EhuD [Halolactibacillus halophilus]GEM02852.1 ectoine/hydroxyectoine ABC transporter permease subunit EhuD [Halolactibacillus halophilus]SFP76621.1 polar amino acid transport system permease protein [Halolactibacillus halophilus]
MNYWSFERFFEAWPYILKGLHITVGVTISAFLFALFFGLVWTFLRRIPERHINWIVTWVMEFIRSTPPLVQLFFIYYAWPEIPIVGVTLSPFASAVVGFGIHFSTYIGEIYRSGIESVENGQWEAATALNFSLLDKWRLIILPQAFPPTIPMLGNYFIIMFKEVPLASTIGLTGILHMANSFGSEHFNLIEALTIVGIIFLVLSYPSARLIKKLEVKLNTRFDKNRVIEPIE